MDGVKTIDIRVLVRADVDEGLFAEQLIRATSGPGAPLGSTVLVDDTSWFSQLDNGYSDEPRVPSQVYVRDSTIEWDGKEYV